MKPISAPRSRRSGSHPAVPFDGMMVTFQAFVFEIAFAERDVPRRVAAQADKVEYEFEIALLRLRGRRLQARDDGGGCSLRVRSTLETCGVPP